MMERDDARLYIRRWCRTTFDYWAIEHEGKWSRARSNSHAREDIRTFDIQWNFIYTCKSVFIFVLFYT